MTDPRRITAELSNFSPPTATIVLRPSGGRGQTKTATSNSLHSLSFGDYVDPQFHDFGALCGLNEITLAPLGGDAAHTHRNVEIITYVTRGEISSSSSSTMARLGRGDAQVLTTGHGLTHQERAQHTGSSTTTTSTHLLQAYVVPWAHALGPAQQHLSVSTPDKRQDAFAILVSPCVGGVAASTAGQALARLPVVPGSMPINADFLMAAAIIDDGKSAVWWVGGGGVVDSKTERHVYVHVPMGAGGSKVRLADQTVLGEGDGAFVTNVSVGDKVVVESVGVAEVEVVVLDLA
ncbi:MAG: hypothetical protein LQ350_007498 [Teloschistes chrysophthalmus]|nr:MAG: hypothetical protein LQ350_007498 [Niorma chrysophthalma]